MGLDEGPLAVVIGIVELVVVVVAPAGLVELGAAVEAKMYEEQDFYYLGLGNL